VLGVGGVGGLRDESRSGDGEVVVRGLAREALRDEDFGPERQSSVDRLEGVSEIHEGRAWVRRAEAAHEGSGGFLRQSGVDLIDFLGAQVVLVLPRRLTPIDLARVVVCDDDGAQLF
jgi:hypothetical protein